MEDLKAKNLQKTKKGNESVEMYRLFWLVYRQFTSRFKAFFDLKRNCTIFKLTPDHEKLFDSLNEKIRLITVLPVTYRRYHFHVHDL